MAASKVDFCNGAVQDSLQSLQELAQRALLENTALQLQEAAKAAAAAENAVQQGGSKKEKKKKFTENRGNYSSFRNKSFIPNASRAGKKGSSSDLLQEKVSVPTREDSDGRESGGGNGK